MASSRDTPHRAERFPARSPIDINENLWMYEERGGLLVVAQIHVNGVYHHTEQLRLPWSKVARSSLRWLAAKRRKK